LSAQKVATNDEQVGQRAGHEQTMSVLRQPAVAHLRKAEYPLDDADRVLDLGTDLGLRAVLGPLDLIDDSPAPCAAIGEVLRRRRLLVVNGPRNFPNSGL
jgi:hypothetical protein